MNLDRPIDTARFRHCWQNVDDAYMAEHDGVDAWVVLIQRRFTPLCDGTPWAGTLRVGVRRTTATLRSQWDDPAFCPPITWDDLFAIKCHFWPDRIAIEIYPPVAELVNSAPMRWLWVLPEGAALPLNLRGPDKMLRSGTTTTRGEHGAQNTTQAKDQDQAAADQEATRGRSQPAQGPEKTQARARP